MTDEQLPGEGLDDARGTGALPDVQSPNRAPVEIASRLSDKRQPDSTQETIEDLTPSGTRKRNTTFAFLKSHARFFIPLALLAASFVGTKIHNEMGGNAAEGSDETLRAQRSRRRISGLLCRA
ncbi:MAG: hypothetical protein ABI782_06540 [Anaerolineaceae bacterium]